MNLLIAGGASDPSLTVLSTAAERMGVDVVRVLHESNSEPRILWDTETGDLFLNDQRISVGSAFVRYDVFTSARLNPMQLDRSQGWYSSILGWCLSTSGVKLFNVRSDSRSSNKLYVLQRARAHGLATPKTIVTNGSDALCAFANCGPLVAKPASGGSYCRDLDEAIQDTDWNDNAAPIPAIIQERLVYPEYRLFRIGKRWIGFEIDSADLDYRAAAKSSISMIEESRVGTQTLARLEALSNDLGLDFCAYDLKSRPGGHELCLLEVNSGPMFAAFDEVAGGALCATMIEELESLRDQQA